MKCPTELTWSMFADGELPEVEARAAAEHLESCDACGDQLAALQGEVRTLVQCLQDIDPDEAVAVQSQTAAQPMSLGKFALGVLGAAAAFRLSTGILFGLELPAELEWLNPGTSALNLNLVTNTAAYLIENGDVVAAWLVQAVGMAFLATIAIAAARYLRRGPALGAFLAVLAAVTLGAPAGYAIDIRRGTASSLASGEVVDDTMIAIPGSDSRSKDEILIAGTVKGDLIAFGNVIRITGVVEGDVIAAARRVEITGKVLGNVLAGSQTLVIAGEIGRNAVGFGSNLDMDENARIGGNAAVFSGEGVVQGTIVRDLYAFAGALDVRGNVGKDVVFRGGQLLLPSSARIGGGLTAHVEEEDDVHIDPAASIVGAKSIKLEPARPSRYGAPRYYFWQIVRLIAAFVTGLIVFRLAPRLAPTSLVSGIDWLKAAGIGFIALVSIPIAAILVAITVIGLPVAISAFVIWGACLYFAKIAVAEFVGRSVTGTRGGVSLFTGLVIVLVAVNIPMLGGLINFVLCLLGLGAIAMTLYALRGRPGLIAA